MVVVWIVGTYLAALALLAVTLAVAVLWERHERRARARLVQQAASLRRPIGTFTALTEETERRD